MTRPESGGRLDRFVQGSLPELTRSRIKRLVEAGRIEVGGQVVKAGYVLREGEQIRITIPDPPAVELQPETIPVTVVHEDEAILVVDKAAGMIVHPGAGRPGGTLVNALLGRGTILSPIGAPFRPGVVHRLDKGTSGLLVLAKTEADHYRLAADLADRSVSRRYWALVWGLPEPRSGRIEGALARSRADRRRMRVVSEGGKEARTRYRVTWSGSGVSAVALALETGRTHQIRAHFKHLGHPVFGDPEYGGRGGRAAAAGASDRENLRAALGVLPRQALHAAVLAFDHPRSGKRVVFESPLPEDIRGAADILGVPPGARAVGKE